MTAMKEWNLAWDNHDLEGVMKLFYGEVLFENWNGGMAGSNDTKKLKRSIPIAAI